MTKHIKKIGYEKEKIIWSNKEDCFLFKDRIIIYKYKIIEIKYEYIESIQIYKKKRTTGHYGSHHYYLYYISLWIKNGKKYKLFMYNGDSSFEAYNGIENITEILLNKNSNKLEESIWDI